jgi:hypothetical protein
MLSADALWSVGSSEQTTVVSESLKDALVYGREALIPNLQDNTSSEVSSCENTLVFGFDNSAQLSTDMVTTTMQEVKTTRELA